MVNELTNVKERILYIAENKGISKETFFKKLGRTYGNFRGKNKNTPLNSDFIVNILTSYPDINPDWLLTGRGEMLRKVVSEEVVGQGEAPEVGYGKAIGKGRAITQAAEPVVAYTRSLPKKEEEQLVPLYDLEARAGADRLFVNDNGDMAMHPIDYLRVPGLPKCDGAVSVSGDSMMPALMPGDIILYKVIHEKTHFVWGHIYLIDTEKDGDSHVVIKYVRPAKNKENIVLASENPISKDWEVSLEKVRLLALVVGYVRRGKF